MLTITLKPELAERVQRVADIIHTSPETLVNDAVRTYLSLTVRNKLASERAAFGRLKDTLIAQYEDEYVAIHQGEVIDHDVSIKQLHHRIYERLGDTTVLLKRVTREPERDIVVRSPKIDRQPV